METHPFHLKENQSGKFTGKTDVEAATPILWRPDVKNWLIWKDPDAGKDWRWEEKGTTEDEMVGWHHWLNRHEAEWTPGVGDGQGGLACCNSWGRKELDTTERLNWTDIYNLFIYWLHWDLSCSMWDLVSWPGVGPRPPALGAEVLNTYKCNHNYMLASSRTNTPKRCPFHFRVKKQRHRKGKSLFQGHTARE